VIRVSLPTVFRDSGVKWSHMWFDLGNPTPLVDAPVEFQITGVTPGQEVLVVATWRIGGVAFEASGRFEADANGAVAPCDQPSLGGTYLGVEPFGLWWSAQSEGEPEPSNLDPIDVTLTATTNVERVQSTITRLPVDPGVHISTVSDDGLVGMYFRPEGDGPFPSVLVVGGSAGGFSGADTTAALLASRGFASLALAYFGLPGLPAGLAEVPLEYFAVGIHWLSARPEVKGRVAVMGRSRGGELALLLAATFPQVGAVVAQSPSGVAWGSFGPGSGPDVAAWTFAGRAVPWLPSEEGPAWEEVYKSRPLVCTPGVLADLSDVEAVRRAEIEIERATCPILMISGEDDALWPSTTMTELVEKRAQRLGFIHSLVHLRFPDAGHLCSLPPGRPSPLVSEHPVDHELLAFGGSREGNAASQAKSWSETLTFLNDVLER
jgi:dienelactone hydrolase